LTYYAKRIYNVAMRILEEKAEKLCSGFSLLDEEEQGYIWGILEALLFAKLKTDAEMVNTVIERQGSKVRYKNRDT